jgi:hypothetical protein
LSANKRREDLSLQHGRNDTRSSCILEVLSRETRCAEHGTGKRRMAVAAPNPRRSSNTALQLGSALVPFLINYRVTDLEGFVHSPIERKETDLWRFLPCGTQSQAVQASGEEQKFVCMDAYCASYARGVLEGVIYCKQR